MIGAADAASAFGPGPADLSARTYRIRWTPEVAAAFATVVDIARIRAAVEGRTMIYVVRAGSATAPREP
jgi:hypothetical protein